MQNQRQGFCFCFNLFALAYKYYSFWAQGMMEKDAYCTDIITQVSAVTAALNSFNKVLLSQHIKTCVIEDIKQGKEDTIDDLLATLQKLMK